MSKKRRISDSYNMVDTISTASERDKRSKKEKIYDTPNECNEFDDYISEMSIYTRKISGSMITKDYRKTMLNFYKRVSDNLIPQILPMSHMIGSIDILKKKLNESEKRFYENIDLLKNDKQAYWKGKRKPIGFDSWPDKFRFINHDDTRQVKSRKRRALRECLNRRITFMKDCVYACSDKITHRYLKLHLDFIVKLQILAVHNRA